MHIDHTDTVETAASTYAERFAELFPEEAVEIDEAIELEEALLSVVSLAIAPFDDDDESLITALVDDVDTFSDLGVLSSNRGLVIRTKSGAEFQLTIVRSR